MSTAVKDIHEELIKSCIRGEPDSYKQLYNLYSKAMYNVCYRIVNDEDDAHDVLQEGFINAFKYIGNFKAESTFGAWLKRIMINKAINFIKKKRLILEEINEERDGVEIEDSQVYEYEEKNLNIQKIQQGIELLPDGYRTVLSLYLIEGYDHSEIAEIMGITESTSKSQFNRSKKKLREIIKSMDYGK